MSHPLSLLKYANDSDKCIVSGFVRSHEISLKLSTIPPLICHLCVAFYYNQEFIESARTDKFKISGDRLSIKSIQECQLYRHTIYCHAWYKSNYFMEYQI